MYNYTVFSKGGLNFAILCQSSGIVSACRHYCADRPHPGPGHSLDPSDPESQKDGEKIPQIYEGKGSDLT